MILNINSRAVVTFTNTLEKMHRSALPYAIRNTLNSVAFDVKKNTMPRNAAAEFTQRSPNFFRANSRVVMATGWNVSKMQATVGFLAVGSKGADQAVKELEQQEYGGVIESRSFIPMDTARGGNSAKPVRPSNRLSRIKKIVNSNTIAGKTAKQKFRHAVHKAGVGGYVIGNNAKKTLFKVLAVGDRMKLRPLFSYKENRKVRVRATMFMREASLESGAKMESIFAREAKRQIERLNK